MPQVKTAVILAAGLGSRLRHVTQEIPKGFLKFGERPIVEESILRLVACGCEKIVVVTGHLASFYEQLARKYPELVELVHNEHFAESGSMYSLWCAREKVTGDLLLLESDLIYESRALEECLATPHASTILLSGRTGAGDEVFVQTDRGRLVTMSKDLERLSAPPTGEFVGITKLSSSAYSAMLAAAESAFSRTRHVSYETDVMVQVAGTVPLHCLLIEDLVWSEIDDDQHFRRAAEVVYPRITR